MPWRRVLRGLGGALVSLGLLVLCFAVYQLWGTGLLEAHSQQVLREQLRSQVEGASRVSGSKGSANSGTNDPTVSSNSSTTTTATSSGSGSYGPPAPQGQAVAIIQIPSIGVDKAVVEGVAEADLQKGPGHYPSTPMPGEPGNAAIAGHRTTFGGPFYRLNDLRPGDLIEVTTPKGSYRYSVVHSESVLPSDTAVLAPTTRSTLTLTTCTPLFSAAERLVVSSVLVGTQAGAKAWVTAVSGVSKGSTAARPNRVDRAAEADLASLAGPPARSWPWAAGWGAIAAATIALVWWAARRTARLARLGVVVVGALPVALTLFVFFSHLSGFLPASF